MNITFDVVPALKAINRVTGIVDRRNTIPILGNVLLTAKDGMATLYATNLDMEASASFPAVGEGSITVPAHILSEILKNLPAGADASLTHAAKDARAKLVAGRSKFALPVLPTEDYPKLTPVKPDAEINLPARDLSRLLKRVAAFQGAEETRYYFTGTYLELSSSGLRATATSGHVLCCADYPLPGGPTCDANVPGQMTAEMARLLDIDGDVTLQFAPGRVSISVPLFDLSTKLIDQRFPDYRRVQRSEAAEGDIVVVDRDSLAGSIRLAVLADPGGKMRTVVVRLADGLLHIAGRGQDVEASDEIEADYSGPPAALLLNSHAVLNVLASLTGDRVAIRFSDDVSPVEIKDPDDPSFVANTMQPRA